MQDDLGDRMKMFEKACAPRCMPLLPVCVRLDGKNFSKWTKGLHRPYDTEFRTVMINVTRYLVQETQACIGYTQSDEISLIYYSDTHASQIFFDGKLQKICSVLASMTTMKFNELMAEKIILHDRFRHKSFALFDCRVWQVPTLQEAVNVLIWREQDATKNSVTLAASSVYSHKQLMNKNGKQKQDMLMEKGINWNDYPWFFKRGVYVKRVIREKEYTTEELDTLPEKHRLNIINMGAVKRSSIEVLENFPKLASIKNAVDVIFNNVEIKLKDT